MPLPIREHQSIKSLHDETLGIENNPIENYRLRLSKNRYQTIDGLKEPPFVFIFKRHLLYVNVLHSWQRRPRKFQHDVGEASLGYHLLLPRSYIAEYSHLPAMMKRVDLLSTIGILQTTDADDTRSLGFLIGMVIWHQQHQY